MPQHVCHGALLMCSFGVAPSPLTVLPANRVMTSSQPAATIMDHTPMVNIAPFGLCMSFANPMVAARNWDRQSIVHSNASAVKRTDPSEAGAAGY